MKTNIKYLPIFMAMTILMSLRAFAGCGACPGDLHNIVDTASEKANLSTLVSAVQAADLVETLKGEGSFTVFAPNDAAFAELPEGELDNLLDPENKDQLVDILTYHVVPGKVMAKDIELGETNVQTVSGKDITIQKAEDGTVKINDTATVIKANIDCTNGVIHVVDTVISLP